MSLAIISSERNLFANMASKKLGAYIDRHHYNPLEA